MLLFLIIWFYFLINFIKSFINNYKAGKIRKVLFKVWVNKNYGLLLGFIGGAVLIFLWLCMSGIGGFGFQNSDYSFNNVYFKSLITSDPYPAFTQGYQSFPVVYYSGYYLPSVLLGKSFGWDIANYFILFWAFLGVLLVFTWIIVILKLKSGFKVLLASIFLILFSGLDIVGYAFLLGNSIDAPFTTHIEFWAGPGFIQYSSNTTLMFWVPQHTLASWLIACIGFAAINKIISVKYISIPVFSSLIWSPFGIIGFVSIGLFIIYKSFKEKILKELFYLPGLIPGLMILIVLGLYFAANSFSFPSGFGWEERPAFFLFYIPFILIEFGIISYLIFNLYKIKGGKSNEFTALFFLSIIGLLLIPLYRMGQFNDFVMRSSIPLLMVLQLCILYFILFNNSNNKATVKQRLLEFTILICFGLGAITGYTEILRSYILYSSKVPDFDQIQPLSTESERDFIQRKGNKDSIFFKYLAKEKL